MFIALIGSQGTLLEHNDSERYESRFVSVKIERNTNALMFKDMQNSVMGVWVAHGEGKFTYSNEDILHRIEENNCIALRYVDDNSNWTET
jgi:phosphoribosylformylglycinamidine synthase